MKVPLKKAKSSRKRIGDKAATYHLGLAVGFVLAYVIAKNARVAKQANDNVPKTLRSAEIKPKNPAAPAMMLANIKPTV